MNVNITNVLLIISFVVEPLVWLHAIHIKFEKKYTVWPYVAYVIIDTILSIIQEFTNVRGTGSAFFSLLFFVYVAVFSCVAYEGKSSRKLLHAGVLLMLSLTSDLIVFIALSLLGVNMQQMSERGLYNSFAQFVSKFVFMDLQRFIFKKKIKIDKEFTPFAFLIAVLEIPYVVLFKSAKETVEGKIFVTYMIGQFAIGAFIMYMRKFIAKRKNEVDSMREKAEHYKKKAEALEEKAIQLETKLNANQIKGMLTFFENRKKIFIKPDSIICVERVGRKIKITDIDKQHEVSSSITRLEEELGNDFFKISQGILVNLNYIQKIDDDMIYLRNDISLYASREKMRELKNAYERR